MKKILLISLLVFSRSLFAMTLEERRQIADRQCSNSDLIKRVDMMNSEFDIVGSFGRLFFVGVGDNAGCAYRGDTNYTDSRGEYIYFNLRGPNCIENGSLWERQYTSVASPNFRLVLKRVDIPSTDTITIDAYRSWAGTQLAQSQLGLAPAICR